MSNKDVQRSSEDVLSAALGVTDKLVKSKSPVKQEDEKQVEKQEQEKSGKGDAAVVSKAMRRSELDAAARDLVEGVRGVAEFMGGRDEFVDPVVEYRERVMQRSLAPGEGEGLPYGVPNPQSLRLPDVGSVAPESLESLKGLVIYDDLKHQLEVGERALSSRSFGRVNHARDPLIGLRRKYPQLEWHLIQVPTQGSATYDDDARLLSEAEQASLRFLMAKDVDPAGANGKIEFNYTREDRGRVVHQSAYVMFIPKEVAQRARLQRAKYHLSQKDNMRNTVLEESREHGRKVSISSSTPEEDTVNVMIPEEVTGSEGSEQ